MAREKTFTVALIVALFVAIIAFIGACNVANKRKPKTKVVTEYDTVFVEYRDTILVEVPTERVRYVSHVVHDTLYSVDSIPFEVVLPIETAMYMDTVSIDSTDVIYSAWVSGHKASLDSISFDVSTHYSIVNTTTTITQKRGGRWGFGVTAGYFAGWDFVRNQFTNGLGLSVGLTYKNTR